MNFGLGMLAGTQLLAGLALQLLVLRIVGAGPLTDAFVAAQTVPMVMSAMLSMLLLAVWGPKLSVAADDAADWRATHRTAQGQVLLCAMPIAVIGWATTTLWLPLLFSDFTPQQQAMVEIMSPPLFASAVLTTHIAMMLTAQRARSHFYLAELLSLICMLLALALLAYWLPKAGIEVTAWVTLLRSFLVASVLYRLSDSPAPDVITAIRAHNAWRQLRAMMTGAALQKSNPVVERYWSAQGPSPGVTLLAIAQTTITAVASVLERAVCVPMAPRIARSIAARDYAEAGVLYRRGISQILLVVIAVGVVVTLLQPTWNSLFNWLLHMPPAHANQVWCFSLLLLGYLLVGAAGPVVVAVFYAFGNTSTPARVSTAGFFVGLALKSIGFLWWGLPGLAAAMSLGHLFNLVTLCVLAELTLHQHQTHEG
ncbi:MAG: lipid II flippase MurJ [Stagnimonas sp.]|nr:lipid II flippase MurJ [Stagnimonas sp.]